MYLSIANFFTQVWVQNSSLILTCFLWGLVGLCLLAPVFFFDAIYQMRRTGNAYHFGEGLHLRRRHYEREITLYGGICALILLGVFCIAYIRL